MRVITAPSVHVLAAPQFFDHPRYKLPKGGTASERLTAHAGKGCYDSYGEDGRSIAEHIQSLVGSGHGSVLEHANVSLFIEGISRGCSHEIVRHRAGFACSQRSTRYTKEDDALIVLDPYRAAVWDNVYAPVFNDNVYDEVNMVMVMRAMRDGRTLTEEQQRHISQCEDLCEFFMGAKNDLISYCKQIPLLVQKNPEKLEGTKLRKWARGIARQSLPHALETRMTMTGNLRAWWNFLIQRSNREAEAEVRRLSNAIFERLYPFAPFVFDHLNGKGVRGFFEFTAALPKV